MDQETTETKLCDETIRHKGRWEFRADLEEDRFWSPIDEAAGVMGRMMDEEDSDADTP